MIGAESNLKEKCCLLLDVGENTLSESIFELFFFLLGG